MTAVIRVEGLGKRYWLGAGGHRTLKQTAAATARWLLGRPPVPRAGEFWALRDVSFEVQPGQVVGVVGRNGAGKSTLLKVLSRITPPTTGRVRLVGRVGSLLEVGTGFHPDLSGRENIYLNGSVLGMRRAEIDRCFDEIVAFSEVGAFLDTPVKRYSSGMYVRLAFAVAAHLETEILIVDEVLAVGDAQFQQKCLGKMGELASSGRTVFFVSHHVASVQRLCTHALMMERGHLVASGPKDEVLERFQATCGTAAPGEWIDLTGVSRTGWGGVRVEAVRYGGRVGRVSRRDLVPEGPMTVDVRLRADQFRIIDGIAVTLSDRHGTRLVRADTAALGQSLRLEPGVSEWRIAIDRLNLSAGAYVVGLTVTEGRQPLDVVSEAFQFEVVERADESAHRSSADAPVACRFAVARIDEPTAVSVSSRGEGCV